MSPDSSDVYPVVSGEGLSVPVAWRDQPVTPDWLQGFLSQKGWKLESLELGESEVRFADGSGAGPFPDPPIQLAGFPGVGSLPALARSQMPTDVLQLTRGQLSLQFCVTEIPDEWARQWVAYLLQGQGRNTQSTPVGSGFASEIGVLIDAGDLLFRASWSVTGASVPPGEVGNYATSPAGEFMAMQAAA
jgi:hypothetical protein